jgi:hypothetical protein
MNIKGLVTVVSITSRMSGNGTENVSVDRHLLHVGNKSSIYCDEKSHNMWPPYLHPYTITLHCGNHTVHYFLTFVGFLHQGNWPPRYNWNICENALNTITLILTLILFLTIFGWILELFWQCVILFSFYASHWQTLSHTVVSITSRMSGIRTQNVSVDRHLLHVGNKSSIYCDEKSHTMWLLCNTKMSIWIFSN